jgi:transporter associated domain-containing protein
VQKTLLQRSALSGGLECDGARSRRYGQFEGLVTNADILEAIAGAFRTEEGAAEPEAVQRDDGSWLISGSMPADEMADRLSISLPPDRSYHTAAGFVLSQLGHLPEVGESFDTVGVSRWSISMVAALTKFWPVASPLGAAAAQLDELASFSCSAPGNVLLHRVCRLMAHRVNLRPALRSLSEQSGH